MTGDFWTVPLAQSFHALDCRAEGLEGRVAAERLNRFGRNVAAADRADPLWRQILRRLANPLVLILLVASFLSALAGDRASFAVIAVIVLVSVALDFVQERRAGHAVEALRRSVAMRAEVRRDGAESSILAELLVPGDIVRLSAGDLVPADGRLIDGGPLFVNQALLTGEPYPVEKRPDGDAPSDGDPAHAANALFAGTSVISGTATMLICRTGKASTLGTLAGTLSQAQPLTAFEIGLRRFGLLIVRLTIFLVLFVLAVNLAFHRPALESLMFALALAVGLTPELLPMIVTVTLARGAMRLAKRRVIVKRLSALHNLGAIDVFCTDKTGTLTEARITMVKAVDGDGADSPRLFELACLNSHFETGLKSPMDDAILDFGSVDVAAWSKIGEAPFDFERRRVSVELEKAGERLLIVKGAPEDIIKLSTRYEAGPGRDVELDMPARARLMAAFEALGEEGYRVLAVASRTVPADASDCRSLEQDLVFAGYAVFIDPPKASAGETVRALKAMGIDVKILTGDNERVSRHVCDALSIPVAGVLTGDEIADLSDEALAARVARTTLFCRVNPAQKHRVIVTLKRRGQTVGFLGDGINDATALHGADVGISVDSAADVAREAADVILLDHDLSVVHEAVREGRRSVVNVEKYILMGSSSNFGNMFSMAGASLLLPFLPMLPLQVMLNNLLYDISQIAIPFDHVDPEMIERPVHWDIGLITRFITVIGPVSSLFDFATFYVLLRLFHANEALFHTGWFIESLATQILVVFAIRTRRHIFASAPHPILPVMALGILGIALLLSLSPAGHWLGFSAPRPAFFVFLAGAVAVYLLLVETVKRLFFRRQG